HFVCDFSATVSRKTVHEYGARGGLVHELAVNLVGFEDVAANLSLGLQAHAGPRIGVNGFGAIHGRGRIGEQFDTSAGFLGDTLGGSQKIIVRRVIGGGGGG